MIGKNQISYFSPRSFNMAVCFCAAVCPRAAELLQELSLAINAPEPRGRVL